MGFSLAFCLFFLQRHTISTPKALSSLVDKRSSYSELSMPGTKIDLLLVVCYLGHSPFATCSLCLCYCRLNWWIIINRFCQLPAGCSRHTHLIRSCPCVCVCVSFSQEQWGAQEGPVSHWFTKPQLNHYFRLRLPSAVSVLELLLPHSFSHAHYTRPSTVGWSWLSFLAVFLCLSCLFGLFLLFYFRCLSDCCVCPICLLFLFCSLFIWFVRPLSILSFMLSIHFVCCVCPICPFFLICLLTILFILSCLPALFVLSVSLLSLTIFSTCACPLCLFPDFFLESSPLCGFSAMSSVNKAWGSQTISLRWWTAASLLWILHTSRSSHSWTAHMNRSSNSISSLNQPVSH